MHGNMQVRFGGRHNKTYCRKAARRDMPSLRMMKWPKNLSGREYNGMNALMLALECEKRGYELPVFCTFDAALSLNYSKKKDGSRQPLVDENGEKLPLVSVQKGEKSFPGAPIKVAC